MSAVVSYALVNESRNELSERLERKFYIRPEKTGFAFGLLNQLCARDTAYFSEQINSLYFDTPDLEQHEISSSGDFRKDKVRIRWYGNGIDSDPEKTVFIEWKSRNGFAGTKKRRKMTVPAEKLELCHLSEGIINREALIDSLAGFGYFPSGILVPVILISYWRYRFTDIAAGQHVSLDCRIRSTMVRPCPWGFEKHLELPGAVLEIKGKSLELPPSLMGITVLETEWTRFSKYSASLDAHNDRPGSIGRLSPSGFVIR